MTEEFKYNYVFFFAGDDYWKAILGKELYEHKQVRVYEGAFHGNRLAEKLFHLHWSYKMNRKRELPFKSLWYKKIYRQDFENELPYCFVYMGGNTISRNSGFCEYVRKRDPRNRQVIAHNDLISKKCDTDYLKIRNLVDLATTYDKVEAEKYHIHYFRETTYSKLLPEPETPDFQQDVYFLGAAKDRYNDILTVFRHLTANGLKCKFIISGVPEEQQITAEGMFYTTGISYVENLQNILQSRCVLEMIQGASKDITTRVPEASAYRRKLLTNCPAVEQTDFCEGQMSQFTCAEDIDIDFLKKEFKPEDFPPRLDMNPLRRLYDIQEQLDECK